jgi:hypothetical protein
LIFIFILELCKHAVEFFKNSISVIFYFSSQYRQIFPFSLNKILSNPYYSNLFLVSYHCLIKQEILFPYLSLFRNFPFLIIVFSKFYLFRFIVAEVIIGLFRVFHCFFYMESNMLVLFNAAFYYCRIKLMFLLSLYLHVVIVK